MQRLLVSVRGKAEALEAVRGGAHIVDVEYPGSALGTPYPLNVHAVRVAVPPRVQVSTNIGELQLNRGTACQAAVGVAVAGADIVKAGLAQMSERDAAYLAKSIVRTVRRLVPRSQVVLALFADPEMARKYVDPIQAGPSIASAVSANGVLVDTFDKSKGKGLLDYLTLAQLRTFVQRCHKEGLEAWLAGSITLEQMRELWDTAVDVICVRAAATQPEAQEGRFAPVTSERVRRLAATLRTRGRIRAATRTTTRAERGRS